MKKIFKKNQIIITALAVMIAAAGYISYSDSKLKTTDTSAKNEAEEAKETDSAVDMDSVLQDIESLDMDITDETTASQDSGETTGTETADTSLDTPGEAVLTGASTYMAQARINREQIRSQNKETLLLSLIHI